jgi:tRNA-dihydrouridine synthase
VGRRLAAGNWHGFMVGRAAMKNPALFSGKDSSLQQAKKLLEEYAALCKENSEPSEHDMKIKAFHFFRGFEGSAGLRREISEGKYDF